jgi:hypothetical protein
MLGIVSGDAYARASKGARAHNIPHAPLGRKIFLHSHVQVDAVVGDAHARLTPLWSFGSVVGKPFVAINDGGSKNQSM